MSPHRRRVVLAVLGLLVVVGAAWLLARRDTGEPGSQEASGFGNATIDARTEMENVDAEMQDYILTAQGGGGSVEAAIESASPIVDRAEELTASFLAVDSAPAVALTKELYVAAARTFTEAARVLATSGTPGDPALAAQLVNKSARLVSIGSALRSAADESLVALEAGNTFVALPGDVPTWGELSASPPGPPLSGEGIPADPGAGVETAIQDNETWLEQAGTALDELSASFAETGDVVRAYEADRDATTLGLQAQGWVGASAGAFATLSGLRRPDTLQDSDVALRNSALLFEEAARCFSDVALVPAEAERLLGVCEALQLTAESLWAAAVGAVERASGAELPPPPDSGFDPALVDPDREPGQGLGGASPSGAAEGPP